MPRRLLRHGQWPISVGYSAPVLHHPPQSVLRSKVHINTPAPATATCERGVNTACQYLGVTGLGADTKDA